MSWSYILPPVRPRFLRFALAFDAVGVGRRHQADFAVEDLQEFLEVPRAAGVGPEAVEQFLPRDRMFPLMSEPVSRATGPSSTERAALLRKRCFGEER